VSLEAILSICKNAENKKLVMSRNILKALIRIMLSSLDDKER